MAWSQFVQNFSMRIWWTQASSTRSILGKSIIFAHWKTIWIFSWPDSVSFTRSEFNVLYKDSQVFICIGYQIQLFFYSISFNGRHNKCSIYNKWISFHNNSNNSLVDTSCFMFDFTVAMLPLVFNAPQREIKLIPIWKWDSYGCH